MVIDYPRQLIFLLGGWDGIKDLADFWVYNIASKQWQCIAEDTKAHVWTYLEGWGIGHEVPPISSLTL